MKTVYKPATIIDIKEESPAVRRFWFRMNEGDFTFKPGQFVMLDLPIESKITNRSYSIASAPVNEPVFELIIVLNPDGKGTPHMWDNYRIGTEVPVAGPLGKFVLPEQVDSDLCFIATGTGIAPLRSMMHYLIAGAVAHKNLYIVFGNRTQQDILYREEFTTLAASHPFISFIPVLSRADESWTGRRGYVHAIYEELFADKRPCIFFLCGWKNMIMEARERLAAMGYERSQIKFELYD